MLWTLDHLLLATAFTLVTALVLVLCIFLGLTRVYPHEATRAQFGAAMASLVITVLFSVMLNNWYAAKRDRDNRLRNLRDQHYAQLKPVLRIESSKLAEVAETIGRQAHMNRVNRYEGVETNLSAMLWPDVISRDLGHHFPDYDKSKHALLSQIEVQDQEFRETVALAEKEIKPTRGADPYWRGVDAMSYVEKCVGRGNGLTLRVTEGGFSFEYWGASLGGSGRPSPDQVAAFRAFESLKPTANVTSHCSSLKNRAEAIRNSAGELSKEAQLLSESTILRGTCEFMTSGSLSD